MGYQLVELKRYEEGIASYNKAIAIKPDKHEAWNNRGWSLAKLQKYEEAIASYDTALPLCYELQEPHPQPPPRKR
ncbi:MAG: tetratricopeptide repeat protein [Dolichospermum sp. DET50]|nr:tetratricopeptide repeat protein [Dolichospermum sp. DET66]MBS3030974.1 tetratricopeptide repeat protein [Dolichospermum sp. DET67]MBS3036184.1 tetratricopeptide repeat protein [Dolichospermum sp. DET50]QSX68258.1 MAG: tetratricopeptide repeat protein [Dolichospermum sp. DET69]